MSKQAGFLVKQGRILKKGFTTGSCATAAASAALEMLFTGKHLFSMKIILPSGESAVFRLEKILLEREFASCTVCKNAGDDPDVTHGMQIGAEVRLIAEGQKLLAGKGVGTVTAPGLRCKVGEAAINPVPKAMIYSHAEKICQLYDYHGGWEIKLFAIDGEKIAKHTFNPRLGIVGGISILGTTGIVEPMSEKALIETIQLELDQHYLIDKEKVLLSPGNYGRAYCQQQLGLALEQGVKVSNFLGEALDYIGYKGFKKVLIVGHIGKMIKVAGGIFETHSRIADARMEILAAHSGLAGGRQALIAKIFACFTTDEALAIIREAGLEDTVLASLKAKLIHQLAQRTKDKLKIEFLVFGEQDKVLMETTEARDLAAEIRRKL